MLWRRCAEWCIMLRSGAAFFFPIIPLVLRSCPTCTELFFFISLLSCCCCCCCRNNHTLHHRPKKYTFFFRLGRTYVSSMHNVAFTVKSSQQWQVFGSPLAQLLFKGVKTCWTPLGIHNNSEKKISVRFFMII